MAPLGCQIAEQRFFRDGSIRRFGHPRR
jgi:hypothetical protein